MGECDAAARHADDACGVDVIRCLPGPPRRPPATPATAAVEVSGFKFAPATLEVAKGTKVTWTNKDTAKHTVTSGKDATTDGKFDGPLEAAPATFSFTFTEAGTYAYFCAIHKSMIATVTVK